ncbi:unnamed protein product [Dovyalis caffra]|uniref:Uncharacterized protein n=1 Tax=Dovyalis caffra TaxID=77055 RepID=A0AAV1SA98_9ROSI|nr:unnamed protein product [Dovyalis caffra]
MPPLSTKVPASLTLDVTGRVREQKFDSQCFDCLDPIPFETYSSTWKTPLGQCAHMGASNQWLVIMTGNEEARILHGIHVSKTSRSSVEISFLDPVSQVRL